MKKAGNRYFLRRGGILIAWMFTAIILTGCASENSNPLAVEKIGGAVSQQEGCMMNLDARGYVNGLFQPNGSVGSVHNYPVSYIGSWSMIPPNDGGGWYLIAADSPSARIDITATMSRAVFDFMDYDQYRDPGEVSFSLDGVKIGEFSLSRKNAANEKILDYMVVTNKTTVSTITMTLLSGHVVVTGYMLVFP